MSHHMFDDYGDADTSPICAFCGVSALAPETPGQESACENAECDAYGEPIPSAST